MQGGCKQRLNVILVGGGPWKGVLQMGRSLYIFKDRQDQQPEWKMYRVEGVSTGASKSSVLCDWLYLYADESTAECLWMPVSGPVKGTYSLSRLQRCLLWWPGAIVPGVQVINSDWCCLQEIYISLSRDVSSWNKWLFLRQGLEGEFLALQKLSCKNRVIFQCASPFSGYNPWRALIADQPLLAGVPRCVCIYCRVC